MRWPLRRSASSGSKQEFFLVSWLRGGLCLPQVSALEEPLALQISSRALISRSECVKEV